RAGSALLYPGPLWRGGRVEESPQDGPQGCEPVFRRYMDVPSENPVTRPRTRRARQRGGLSVGYFSLATQRKVTRAATAARNYLEPCVSIKEPGARHERNPGPAGHRGLRGPAVVGHAHGHQRCAAWLRQRAATLAGPLPWPSCCRVLLRPGHDRAAAEQYRHRHDGHLVRGERFPR